MKSARILPDARDDESRTRKGKKTRDNPDHIYRVIEIVGTSEKASQTQSTERSRAHKTLRNAMV